jgi:hypothetical protein
MPRAAKTKIDPSQVHVCWMSGAAVVNCEDVRFTEGERLRGDSPAVRACGQFSSWTALPRASGRTLSPRLSSTRRPKRAAPDYEVQLAGPLPTPIAVEDVIQLTRAVTLRGGYVEDQKVATARFHPGARGRF